MLKDSAFSSVVVAYLIIQKFGAALFDELLIYCVNDPEMVVGMYGSDRIISFRREEVMVYMSVAVLLSEQKLDLFLSNVLYRTESLREYPERCL